MWIFSKKKRLTRQFSDLSVVYTYSIEDIPGRTLAVKVPHESVKAAKHALLHAHRAPSHKRINRDELVKALEHLDRSARRKASAHFAGPSAAHVRGGLVVGSGILGDMIGKKVLVIKQEVLTNHQYVDIVRAAGK